MRFLNQVFATVVICLLTAPPAAAKEFTLHCENSFTMADRTIPFFKTIEHYFPSSMTHIIGNDEIKYVELGLDGEAWTSSEKLILEYNTKGHNLRFAFVYATGEAVIGIILKNGDEHYRHVDCGLTAN